MRSSWVIILSFLAAIIHLYISLSTTWCTLNDGVAFGIDIHLGIIVLAFLFALALAIKERQEVLLWAIVIAASINILDRVLHGGVCDYIRIWKLPVFNLNDCIIVVSIIMLGIKQWTELKNTK